MAEALLSASLRNAGADGCVGGRCPGVSTESRRLCLLPGITDAEDRDVVPWG